ncbi:MAG: NAD(P)H-dependent oxidoreductase subunit E [Peptostreptococcaceae bacterium]|nr:NAD(P)H-dependent oxidoreductase subunit E [Peptostreptococcaceae bacterium]
MDEEMRKVMDGIVEEAGSRRSAVITILQQVQGRYRYLPEEALRYLAEKLDMSPTKIFGIATFYENFSLEQKGKYLIRVCDGTACHVRKSTSILDLLYRELGLSGQKKTTEDFLFTVETVSCLGACGLAPVMTVNDKVYGKMTQEALRKLLTELKEVEAHENQ